MKNKASWLGLIFLIGALAAGVYLVKRNQETRKGATANETMVMVLPGENTVKQGEMFTVEVMVATGAETDKLQGAEIKVLYDGGKIKYHSLEGLNGYTVVNKGQSTMLVTDANGDEQGVDLRVVTLGEEKGDIVSVARLAFSAIGTGEGQLTPEPAKIMINGQSATWEVKEVMAAKYTIGGSSSAGKCGAKCTQNSDCEAGWLTCKMDCVPRTGVQPAMVTLCPKSSTNALGWCRNSACPEVEGCDCSTVPRATITKTPTTGATITTVPTTEVTKTPTEILTQTPTQIPTVTQIPTATQTPTPIPTKPVVENGANGVLKFKVTFAGVVKGAQCANWPVTVTVLDKLGNSKNYGDLQLATTGVTADNKNVYQGELLLKGMTSKTGLAVFLKGPRHIQMKYGKNGQNDFYNQEGGELEVSTDADQTPIYDFTAYSMMAGDVNQDGKVDGVDFSLVKTEANGRTEGDNMADLNGNCKMESQDLALLMLTLKEKQEQLY